MASVKLVGLPTEDFVPGTYFDICTRAQLMGLRLKPSPSLPPQPPMFAIADMPRVEPVPGLCVRIEFAEPSALQVALREGLMRGIARGLRLREIAKKTRQ